jgi:DNA polymerase-3 subunit alpha
VEGERDGETLKLRAQAIESLDRAAAGCAARLKVVLDRRAIQAASRLADLKGASSPAARAPSPQPAARRQGREVEIAMPGKFDISPAQKGAIATVPACSRCWTFD